jgi:D-amino-acid dehydrogenase
MSEVMVVEREPEVLVVGAGVVGVATAYALAERGQPVVAIDAGEVGAGCSYGNAGLIAPSSSMPLAAPGVLSQGLRWLLDKDSPFYIKPRPDPALIAWLRRFQAAANEQQAHAAVPLLRSLKLAGRRLYDRWSQLAGMDCDYAREGVIHVYRSRSGLAEAEVMARRFQTDDLPFEVLDDDALKARVPNLHGGVAGGVLFAEDGRVNPAKFVTGLAGLAEASGATFLERTEAIGFTTSRGRITAVETTKGEFRPDQVVLAAGAWSPGVVRDLRLKLPIQPAKGYSLTFNRPDGFLDIPLLLAEAHAAINPIGPLVRVAGTLELAGMDFSINRRRVAAVRRAAGQYLEGFDELTLIETWRGMRPCTPDGLPVIGRTPKWDNLVIATGHAMIGMAVGPVTGEIVADLICGEEPEFDLKLMRYERFSEERRTGRPRWQ